MLFNHIWRVSLSALFTAGLVVAQSSSAATTTVFSSPTTFTSTSFSRSGSVSVPALRTAITTVVNVTSVITPTSTTPSSTASSATASASASATPTPIVLATVLDPAFGVLGAILILTGIPSAFLGHKNRWTSFFLVGFYTLSLVCFVLILKFGVLDAVNPPSKTVRGMFVLASSVAGIAGGGVAIFFWKATKFFIGGWGGFALALWVQCFRNGGLIRTIGLRWILYIGCAVVGFVLCTIPKIHYHVLLVSTAFIGASSLMLGVDCFTTADLKEFYIWNLGFASVFPKYKDNGIEFPVSQTMQIELGLIGAVAIMGAAVQFRILKVLQRKLKEITEEQRRRDAQDDAKAAERFIGIDEEKAQWDREHPTFNRHLRADSDYSGMPLMAKNGEVSPEPESSTFGRQRLPSGLSEFMTATPTDDDLYRNSRAGLGLGTSGRDSVLLPNLDFGKDIQDNVPKSYIAADINKQDSKSNESVEDLRRKEKLLAEIEDIRRNIDNLKAGSTEDLRERHQSLASRRTLSYDLATAVLPEAAHARPPRGNDPRTRSNSTYEMNRISSSPGNMIGRPSSTPLRDEDWDAYVRERKLLQPPQGVSAPIPTSTIPARTPSPRLPLSPAVQEALARRQQTESMFGFDEAGPSASGARNQTPSPSQAVISPVPRAARPNAHHRPGSYLPPTILPPLRTSSGGKSPTSPTSPAAPRTATYEELEGRHRQKMSQLQAPLTAQERERDDIARARARWERSRALEKQDVERRQAERAARPDAGRRSHSRSLSADKLASAGVGANTSKRTSIMKVEDWQRYQAEAEPRKSNVSAGGVPFPAERRHSRRPSNLPSPRDPPT